MAIPEEPNYSEDEQIGLFNTTNNLGLDESDEDINSINTNTSSMPSLCNKNCDDSLSDDDTL